jgi:hypothetical protein
VAPVSKASVPGIGRLIRWANPPVETSTGAPARVIEVGWPLLDDQPSVAAGLSLELD